jgi:hypothetical protein
MKRLSVAISALLAAAAPAGGQAPRPDRQQIEAAAAACGLPASFLRAGRDAQGDFADVSPNGELDRLDPKAFLCLVRWAERTGARIGFLAEPPAGPRSLGRGPAMSIARAAKAARACGLPVHVDPLSPDEAVLQARLDAPPGPLRCARNWIERHRSGLGLRPGPAGASGR